MKKRIKKILLSFLLIGSIFSCFLLSNFKVKADTNIPNNNSYMLNLQDIYLTFREAYIPIDDFIGTTCIRGERDLEFFKVGTIWFNRIYIQISANYELTIYYLNSFTSQRVDVIVNNTIYDFNAININVMDTTYLFNLEYFITASSGVIDLIPSDFFNILFTNVDTSYPIKSGIYRFNFPDLFPILNDIGENQRITNTTDYSNITWSYRYILYSPNDIVLRLFDGTSIYCNMILIGSYYDGQLCFYFLKDNFSDYRGLYFFDNEDNQFIDYDYPVYSEIETIYIPYNSGIYALSSDEPMEDFSADYVFNITFIYGYNVFVHNWYDFFTSIIDVPVLYLRSLTNFEIFGVNLFYTLTGIMTTLFIIWLIRKF